MKLIYFTCSTQIKTYIIKFMTIKQSTPSKIYPARSLANPSILHCLGGAQVQAIEAKYDTYKKENGKTWCFETVLKGSGYLKHNKKMYSLQKGDTYITSPFALYEYFPDDNDLWEKLFIEVEGSLIDALAQTYNLHNNPVHTVPMAMPLIEQLNSILLSSAQGYFAKHFPLVLHQLCMCFEDIKTTKEYQICDYLDRKVNEPFQLDQMADDLQYSKNYLIKLFKKKYNTTPYKYLLNKRIEQACWALSNTNIELKNIAARLQFSDTKHLSATLKRLTGKSPIQWRQTTATE